MYIYILCVSRLALKNQLDQKRIIISLQQMTAKQRPMWYEREENKFNFT